MKRLILLCVFVGSAKAAVVGSLEGPGGEKLLLTDEAVNCKYGQMDAYVIDAKNNSTAIGCWFVHEGEHIAIDWVEHGRRYWPAAVMTWGKKINGKLRSPGI